MLVERVAPARQGNRAGILRIRGRLEGEAVLAEDAEIHAPRRALPGHHPILRRLAQHVVRLKLPRILLNHLVDDAAA